MAGTSRSGVISDIGAALMLVRFHRQDDEPGKSRGEIILPARDLGELYPDEWRNLLAEATRERARPPRTGRKRGRRRRRRR